MTRHKASVTSPAAPVALLGDIRALIEASHQRAASAVNAELTLLFWRIGQRIHTEVLAGQRAGYGEEILLCDRRNPAALAQAIVRADPVDQALAHGTVHSACLAATRS